MRYTTGHDLTRYFCDVMAMDAIRVRCRLDGPLVIEGPVTIVDHEGNTFAIPGDKPKVALCRCGQSSQKPFCDGSHKACGFKAAELAQPPD